MRLKNLPLHEPNLLNQKRYGVTAWFYDILDWPWELQYRKWRPQILADVAGEVLEAGVGTGWNLAYYPKNVRLFGVAPGSPANEAGPRGGDVIVCVNAAPPKGLRGQYTERPMTDRPLSVFPEQAGENRKQGI